MKTNMKWRYAVMPVALMAFLPAVGCGEDGLPGGLDNIAEQCGLTCDAKGIVEGNASISGNASVDAFFGAVVDFKGAAEGLSADVRGQLDAIAVSVGLEPGAASADIKGAIQAKLSANVSGGVKVKAQPPKCTASLEVTANAAASCDADIDPGSVEVSCEGSCTIDASMQAECSAKGELSCSGTAPNLECAGTCTGSCTLEVGAACEGTCKGECTGECSVKDASGQCAGACDGECKGSCEMTAGGECAGKCEGSCEWTPPGGECSAGVEAKCNAEASADIKCKGGCEGKATPPKVSAECQASVEAKANASATCTPPSLDISYQWNAAVAGDVNAQAEFKAWLTGFKGHYAGLLAASAKAEILLDLGANLATSGKAAVEGFVDGLGASANLKASIGAVCALQELPKVAGIITAATGEVSSSVEGIAAIGGALN